MGVALVVFELAAAFAPLLFHLQISVYALGLAVATAFSVAIHYRTVVRIESDALAIISARGARRIPWSEVLELSWFSSTGASRASGPVVRVRGGPYDEPRPNLPAQVGSVLLMNRRTNREAAHLLSIAAEEHGIPFTPNLLQLISSGKRRPRLPGE